jgi:hypothetical protein
MDFLGCTKGKAEVPTVQSAETARAHTRAYNIANTAGPARKEGAFLIQRTMKMIPEANILDAKKLVWSRVNPKLRCRKLFL